MKTIYDLPDHEVRHVLKWVRYLLVTLRCSQWSVVLAEAALDEPGEDEDYVHASVHTHSENRVAVLQLGGKWDTTSDGEKRHTLVHEMLHLATKELDTVASAWLAHVKDSAGFALLQYSDALERYVDHLAFCLTPFLPQWDAERLFEDETLGTDLRVAREGALW